MNVSQQPVVSDRTDNLQLNLAYNEMSVSANGSVLSREEKSEIRFRHGYCRECEGLPIQLFSIKKSRLNPLWVTKEPRDVPRECAGGICFVCHPDRDPRRKRGRRRRVSRDESDGNNTKNEGAGGQKSFERSGSLRPIQQVDMYGNSPTEKHMEQNGNTSSTFEGTEPLILATVHAVSPGSSANSQVKPHPSPNSRGVSEAVSPAMTPTGRKTGTRQQWAGVYVPEVMLQCSEERDYTQSQSTCLEGSDNLSFESLSGDQSSPISSDETHTQNSTHSESSSRMSQLFQPIANNVEQNRSIRAIQSSLSDREITGIIDGIDALVQGVMDSGSSEFLVDIILGSLREHHSNARVQSHCLRIIEDLCKESERHKVAMMWAGVLDDIIRASKTHAHDAVVQERGCGIIWLLGVDSAFRISLIRAGACQQIVLALQNFVTIETLVQKAISALRSLSPEAEAREIFQQLRASKSVSEAMGVHRRSVTIQRDGCAFLSNCAVNIEKQVVTLVPLEELDAIVQAMANHRNETSVMQGACFALKNYTYDDRNSRTLRKCRGVDDLIFHAAKFSRHPSCADDASYVLERMQVSKIMDESLEDEACNSLQRLVDSQRSAQETLRSVLDVMRDYDWSARVNVYCMQLFQNTVSTHGGQLDSLISDGMHQQIFKYCLHFDNDENVCKETCKFLVDAAASTALRPSLVDAGACQVIFKSLLCGRYNENVVLNALKALALLLSVQECYVQFLDQMGLVTEAIVAFGKNESIEGIASSIFSVLDNPPK